jgi:hypothetical protein
LKFGAPEPFVGRSRTGIPAGSVSASRLGNSLNGLNGHRSATGESLPARTSAFRSSSGTFGSTVRARLRPYHELVENVPKRTAFFA